MAKKISFDNISFGYEKGIPLFKGLSFSINQHDDKGHVVGLMGNRGSGKSTLLKLLLGTERIWSGRIDIQPEGPVISYVPQEPVLFEHLTPLENAMYFSKTKQFKNFFNENRFKELLAILDMGDLLKSSKSINEISAGQKQRISLLRALSINPDILLLDEPLTGLDERVKYPFLVILAQLAKEYNLLMIYATHHRQEIELISDEIVFLETDKELGCIHDIVQKPTSAFFEKPQTLSALYLSKGHETNVLPVVISRGIDSKKKVSLYTQDNAENTEVFHICFNQDTIQTSKKEGWEFTIINNSDGYEFLRLTDNQSIIVRPINHKNTGMHKVPPENYPKPNSLHKAINDRIVLNGYVDIYRNEKYIATKRIINNHISDE